MHLCKIFLGYIEKVVGKMHLAALVDPLIHLGRRTDGAKPDDEEQNGQVQKRWHINIFPSKPLKSPMLLV